MLICLLSKEKLGGGGGMYINDILYIHIIYIYNIFIKKPYYISTLARQNEGLARIFSQPEKQTILMANNSVELRLLI